MQNKRGQDLSTSAIILIVLGILILGFVAYGLSTNWSVFSNLFASSGSNVDNIVTQCQTACATGSKYGFCTQQRTLKADDLPDKSIVKTCYELTGADYSNYGINACSAITC